MESIDPASSKLWEAHPSPYGVPYYYNPVTKESRWTIPTGPLDRVVPAGSQGSQGKEVVPKSAGPPDAAQAEAVAPSQPPQPAESVCSVSSCSSGSDSETSQTQTAQTLTAQERAQLKVQQFTQMLEELKVPASDRFETWLPRLAADLRFTAVPKAQRKPLFQKVLQRMAAGKREVEASTRRHNRQALEELLSAAESQGILDKATTAEEAIAKISANDLGQNPCWKTTPLTEKSRMTEVLLRSISQKKALAEEQSARDFRALLHETFFKDPDGELPTFEEARKMLRYETRWKALTSRTLREGVYNEMSNDRSLKLTAARKAKADEEDDAGLARIRTAACMLYS